MKTTNNAQKTVNGQMKMMVLRGAAVIISLVLISWTVSAQDFWKELLTNNTYGKIAMLMIEQDNETKSADAAIEAIEAELTIRANHSTEALVLEVEAEKELEIESWMTDESNFSASTNFFAVEAEEALIREDWMTNDVYFTSLTADAEPALEMETWMLQETNFSSAKTLADTEPEMEIESWMLDDNAFGAKTENEKMELEAWMTDSDVWGF
ncbi:MAG: hypothetical protein JZU47_19615 [Prolixibacteraceae bacterium]|nr:hypothetical protein [Prolixibacteraceae bacterium]